MIVSVIPSSMKKLRVFSRLFHFTCAQWMFSIANSATASSKSTSLPVSSSKKIFTPSRQLSSPEMPIPTIVRQVPAPLRSQPIKGSQIMTPNPKDDPPSYPMNPVDLGCDLYEPAETPEHSESGLVRRAPYQFGNWVAQPAYKNQLPLVGHRIGLNRRFKRFEFLPKPVGFSASALRHRMIFAITRLLFSTSCTPHCGTTNVDASWMSASRHSAFVNSRITEKSILFQNVPIIRPSICGTGFIL